MHYLINQLNQWVNLYIHVNLISYLKKCTYIQFSFVFNSAIFNLDNITTSIYFVFSNNPVIFNLGIILLRLAPRL